MEIRPFDDRDLGAALALNNDNLPAVSELDEAELARLVGLTSTSLVAAIDGAFVGFCLVMPPGVDYASANYRWFAAHAAGLGYGDFAYLDRIAVAETARRQGVGRTFYATLVNELTDRAPVLFCEVNVRPRNESSLAFHDSIGFREVGQQDTSGSRRVSLLALDL